MILSSREQAEEEEEEQRHQQWLKEREEKITAIQQALKHQGPKGKLCLLHHLPLKELDLWSQDLHLFQDEHIPSLVLCSNTGNMGCEAYVI